MPKEIPIGEIIKQKLKDNDRSMSWLAKKANCDSSNFLQEIERQ